MAEIPPYQVQPLIEKVLADGLPGRVTCAQAQDSEIFIGCSNGELFRFALEVEPDKLVSYKLLSRQTIPGAKQIEEIVLVPSVSKAFVFSDRQIFFYTLPSLELIPSTVIKTVRNVLTFTVDYNALRRPPPTAKAPPEPVEFCVLKRNTLLMYILREKIFLQKEFPLNRTPLLARRIGHSLIVADDEYYNVLDLVAASLTPVLPLSQAALPEPETGDNKQAWRPQPHIVIVNEAEFLLLSWTGNNTLGVFVTPSGDPVRGTLEWPSHPVSVCMDYPHVTALLPNGTIEIQSVETQSIIQVIPAPDSSLPNSPKSPRKPDSPESNAADRRWLVGSLGGYMVPSGGVEEKMRMKPVSLMRRPFVVEEIVNLDDDERETGGKMGGDIPALEGYSV